jgi:hypothetical protein
MTSKLKGPKMVRMAVLLTMAVLVDGGPYSFGSFISDAQARVGRPLTPVSVAGVARRTTRRVVRRSSIYVAVLPASCGRVVVDGISYHYCGGTYYQPYNGTYVVVYIN